MRRLAVDTPKALAHKQDVIFMASGIILQKFRLGIVLAGALLGSLLISIAPAMADLRVCNETSNPLSIALGYKAERGWQSEGWWVANPTQCATVYQGDLNARFYYLYVADDIGGGSWDGSVFMCTRDETFTIFGVEDCLARGYERTGFFEVDTQNRSDWTLQLTDPNSDTAPAGDDGSGPPMSMEPDDPAAPPPGTAQDPGPGAPDGANQAPGNDTGSGNEPSLD
jgi:uncharacterized membrane protein